MQLEQLQYIIKVAETKNISKASKKLLISQSALSQSIRKLEQELGVKIFNRERSGVSITESGKHIVNLSQDVMNKVNNIVTYSERHGELKKIRIGIIAGLHLTFIPDILSELKDKFPNLNIELIELTSLEIIEAIKVENIDLGILAIYEETEQYNKDVEFIKLESINMNVFISRHSKLSNKAILDPSYLTNEKFITYNGEYMMWFYSKYRQRYGDFVDILNTKNNQTINEMIKNNLAIAIEIETEIYNKDYINTGDIKAIPLSLNEKFELGHLGLGYTKQKELHPTILSLLHVFEKHFYQMIFS